ncbi:MAG TPA: PEP-CTERM sorting domain-containing protein [Candidatus Acidoferrales bacterium]|nr:PEP-CTERM sorting domain-containing protein [Candidatus Acidoferrales bacterium]
MMVKRLVAAVFLVLAAAWTALASSAPVDPSIILRDATCGIGCQVITTSNFTFTVDSNGGGVFDFEDEVGDLTSLTFIFENPGGINNGNLSSTVNCQVLAFFDDCNKSVLGNGNIEIIFSGIAGEGCSGDSDDKSGQEGSDSDAGNNGHNECNGIPKGTIFTLDLFNQQNGTDNCDKKTGVCTGGWAPDSSVSGIAGGVPEPGTLLLILTAVPLIGRRKRQ